MNPRNRRNVRPGRQVYGARGQAGQPRRSRAPINPQAARLAAYVVVAFFVVMGIWQVFSVSKIEVKGNATLSTEQVTQLVNQSFGRHLFSGNLLTLSLAKLPQELPASSERIQAASVKRSWPNKITVTVQERTGALGWKSGSQVYALDSGGKVIGLLSELNANVPVVEDSTNLPIKVGGVVAPARFVSFCTKLVQKLPATGLGVTGLRIADTTSEVYASTNKGYYLKLDTTRGVEEELADLKLVLATLSAQKKTPAEYIDLRIAGKAYAK